MWPRVSIIAGLLAGVVIAGLLLGGLLFAGPAFIPAPIPVAVDPASPSADASGEPSLAPSAAPSPSLTETGSPAPSSTALSHIGETAPALVVPRVGGGTIDLAKLRGRPVWLDFMRTDCQPCRDEFPLMDGFATRYAADKLVVLAIDVNEDEAAAVSFANELGATFPLGLDADGTAAAGWGATALPVHFWIDAEGVVRDGVLGGIGNERMAVGLATILPGVEVSP